MPGEIAAGFDGNPQRREVAGRRGIIRGAGLIPDRHRRLPDLHEREDVIVAGAAERSAPRRRRTPRGSRAGDPGRGDRKPPAASSLLYLAARRLVRKVSTPCGSKPGSIDCSR